MQNVPIQPGFASEPNIVKAKKSRKVWVILAIFLVLVADTVISYMIIFSPGSKQQVDMVKPVPLKIKIATPSASQTNDQDLQIIDKSLQDLSRDMSSVDQGLSDQQINLE